MEAIGPETFTCRELASMVAHTLGLKRAFSSVSPAPGDWSCRLMGWGVRDVVITREKIQGATENRLDVDAPPLGAAKWSEWVAEKSETPGRHYTGEMRRRIDRRLESKSN